MIYPGAFFFLFSFFKILIPTIFFLHFFQNSVVFVFVFRGWGWGWGVKRQKLIRTCHTDQDHIIYIISYTYHHIHIIQVSLGVFLYFLKILIFRGVRKKGGVKEYRMTQNDSSSKMPKRILICAPPSSHVCDLLKKYSDILGKNQKFVAVL